jgi:hypothetical protein
MKRKLLKKLSATPWERKIFEVLSGSDDILADMAWSDAAVPTGHTVTERTWATDNMGRWINFFMTGYFRPHLYDLAISMIALGKTHD